MELCKDSYQKGYDDVYGEMYRSTNNDDYREKCDDSCRACGVVAEVTENVVQHLAVWMTGDEIDYFTDLITRVGEHRSITERAGRGPEPVGWVFPW